MLRRRGTRLWFLPAALMVAAGCNQIFGIVAGNTASSTGGSGTGGAGTRGATGSSATGGHGGHPTASVSATASSGGTGGTGGGPVSGITVTPGATTLLALTTLTFKASGGGAVTWSVDSVDAGGGGGTVDKTTGAYTAPAAKGSYTLRATSVAAPTEQGTATIDVEREAQPVTLVATGELSDATGNGSQSHLVYATGTGEWWLFHDPEGQPQLATAHSTDFATWSAGAPITLGQQNSGFGRDLDVAYRHIGGGDVIHITQACLGGSDFGRYHIRATVTAGQIHAGNTYPINTNGSASPDGSATAILPSGTVIDSTGYQNTPGTPPLSPCGSGDVDMYVSTEMDDGSATLDNMKFPMSPQVIWCVGSTVNARQIIPVGETAVHLHADGAGNPPTNILVEVRSAAGDWAPLEPSAGPPATPPSVFSSDQSFDLDDWTSVALGGQVHVVRRITGSNAFEYQVLTLTGSPTAPVTSIPGPGIPPKATLPASGLFLAPYGDGLVLVALGPNNGDVVLYTAFDGNLWSDWAQVVAVGNSTSYLSGYAPDSGAKPAVIWTQPAGSSFGIGGALLP
jgi:hypothetical protein